MGKDIFYLFVAAGVLLLVAGVGFFILQQRLPKEAEQTVQILSPPARQEQGLGSELSQNPGSQVPETNPFRAETNPFEGYKNPFD